MAKQQTKYTKNALINSERFSAYRDLLSVMLKEELYTIEQVDKKVKEFLTKGVK